MKPTAILVVLASLVIVLFTSQVTSEDAVAAASSSAALLSDYQVWVKSSSDSAKHNVAKRDSELSKKRASSKEEEDDDDDDNDSKAPHKNAEEKKVAEIIKTNFNFIHAFFASLSVIVVSEIGDKTFFIAAIMAMKHSRFTVYSGAMLALGLMTLLSALLGNILTKFLPKKYTYYASSFLFALFGLKMLKEGYEMTGHDANEEYEEASSTLRESEEKNALEKDVESGSLINGESSSATSGDASKTTRSFLFVTRRYAIILRKYISAVFLQAFILTFLAEWGDRSQISTIILAARENMFGTVLGGTLGHGLCTGLAVIGGRFIAQKISVRTVTLVGAFVFLFFAFSALFMDPEA